MVEADKLRQKGLFDRVQINEQILNIFDYIRNYSGTKWQRHIGTKQIRVVSLFFPSLCLWYSVPLRLLE